MGEDWFVKYTEKFNRLWSNRACRTRLDRTRSEDVERERMEIEKDKQDRACNWRLIHGKAVKATFGYSWWTSIGRCSCSTLSSRDKGKGGRGNIQGTYLLSLIAVPVNTARVV